MGCLGDDGGLKNGGLGWDWHGHMMASMEGDEKGIERFWSYLANVCLI
jgi:hypothetical protein